MPEAMDLAPTRLWPPPVWGQRLQFRPRWFLGWSTYQVVNRPPSSIFSSDCDEHGALIRADTATDELIMLDIGTLLPIVPLDRAERQNVIRAVCGSLNAELALLLHHRLEQFLSLLAPANLQRSNRPQQCGQSFEKRKS
ncbi:hypothetical protein [Hoeflea halophila]|uniref:hypothetical protein n=1 Tax=Hoeflea halophila TaxID=714899 RepID=UPI00117A6DFB|nr:hypothetical protein [Hoeflea halophila]